MKLYTKYINCKNDLIIKISAAIRADLNTRTFFFYLPGFLSLILLLSFCPIITGDSNNTQTIRYHGIRPDDPGGRDGLTNPERGFRLESYIGQPPGGKMWGQGAWLKEQVSKGYSDNWFLMNTYRYKAYGITLHQAYCYLTEFYDMPLSDEQLTYIQRSLDRMRQAGQKVLLRFAYEKSTSPKNGPTAERILQHLDQLAPIIKKNSDIIYVLQAGMVGAWGEWHASFHKIEKDHNLLSKIVTRELEILPKDRMVQLRVMPKYKALIMKKPLSDSSIRLDDRNAFNGTPVARLGFANDGTMATTQDGGTWPEPPYYATLGNPAFDRVTEESPFMAVDGEMYWSDQGGKIDGMRIAVKRLRLHHFTSFSLTHSYSGYQGKRYSIDRWMETPVTAEQLQKEKLPVSDGYFYDYANNPVSRTMFEYIRDHLGYRLELQQAVFPHSIKNGQAFNVEVSLINRGFATLINPRPVYLVLINTSAQPVSMHKCSANPQSWQPYMPGDSNYKPLTHSITETLDVQGLTPGEYLLGLWLPDASESIRTDARYAIRVANRNAPWWETADCRYGVNILGTVKITE